MYEVEVKIRTAHGPVRERLAALGAERIETVRQSDTYYAAPHRDFAETDEALRTRRETVIDRTGDGSDDADASGRSSEADADAETRITYKGPLVEAESKTREEYETAVGDAAAARGILDGLGFDPAATVEKERERYAVDGYTVTLDAVAGVGEFVEVERAAEESEIERAREGAYEVLRDLGLDPADQIRTSYLTFVLDADEGDAVPRSNGASGSDDAGGPAEHDRGGRRGPEDGTDTRE